MTEPVPIACTLTRTGLRDRGAAWRRLLGSGDVDRRRVPGGVRLTARPGAEAALLELVELERSCCAWMQIEITGATVTITSESAAGRAVLTQLFMRLPYAGRLFGLMGVLAALACAAACALPFAVVAGVLAGVGAGALALARGALLPAAAAVVAVALVALAAGVWTRRRAAAGANR